MWCVSLIIPVLNAARTLPFCLEALKRLDPAPDEILLVDNGSTDGSLHLLETFARQQNKPGVQVIEEPKRGASAARNAGARIATGEILAFTDSDCSPEPDWLKQLTDSFSRSAIGAVAGRVVPATSSSTVELFSALYTLRLAEAPCLQDHWTPCSGGYPTANLAVRRQWARDLGGFDEEIQIYGEDYDFCARLYERGGVIAYEPRARVSHHHRTSLPAMLRQAYGFGRGHAYLLRRHGGSLLWVDFPRRSLSWRGFPVPIWLDLSSPDKKLVAFVILGGFYSPLWLLLPLYALYLILKACRRARDGGFAVSLAMAIQLAGLLVIKSGAMTAGRWAGSLRHRRLCF